MSASSDFDVIFKIYKNKIREIYVEQSSDKNYTLAFSGETNVFDELLADVTGDGDITILDATAIQAMLSNV